MGRGSERHGSAMMRSSVLFILPLCISAFAPLRIPSTRPCIGCRWRGPTGAGGEVSHAPNLSLLGGGRRPMLPAQGRWRIGGQERLVLSMGEMDPEGGSDKGKGDDISPEEAMIESLVEKLELSLDTAIKKEHFKDAQTLRDELRKMHVDDSSSVLRANSDFYKAFTSKNITLMKGVWQDSDTVQCVQPGSRPVVGYKNVLEMWSNMFTSKDHAFSTTQIKPSNVRVHVRGTSAFVMCTEEVSGAGLTRRMIATNIFRKVGREWKLMHHHASQTARGGAYDAPKGSGIPMKPGTSRIIRLDGASLMGENPKMDATGDPVMDDIVKAIMGALGDGEGGGDGIIRSAEIFEDIDDSDSEDEDSDEDDDEYGDSDPVVRITKHVDLMPPSSRYEEVPAERELGEGVTERTVEALRKLQADGKISREEKRKLIADIIEHHKAGEAASSIEIAYELLVAPFVRPDSDLEGKAEAACLEDLADQAKSIASGLRF